MSSDDDSIVLKVKNISKCFEIYDKPVHRLYQTLCAGYKKFYKEFWALRNINLEVRKGDCIGIIGRNGAGKSTLLQIITGTLQATSGQVETHGRIAALLELGSGFNPEFTGRENVFMNAAVLGLTTEEINRKYSKIVEFADIGDFINQPVKTYSSGMVLRLAFAVIANVEADILIVDEALAVGDVFFTQKCMRFIREFKKKHTILFVSHDTASVVGLCNKAILLDHGEIILKDEAKKVAEHYLALQISENQKDEKRQENGADTRETDDNEEKEEECFRDMRQDFVVTTNLRNDIELMQFNSESSFFGTGKVKITDVWFTDMDNKPLAWTVGGEMVMIKISAVSYEDIFNPIVGFIVKDRLGQGLFAANTCISYAKHPLYLHTGEKLQASFCFRMPILYQGDYSIMVSVGEGTQEKNIQHHWLHDAYIFRSHSPVPLALMGIPMKDITLKVIK